MGKKDETKIIDYFPKKLRPRPVQKEALEALAEAWNSHDVFVINLPVATGKSGCAITLSKWCTKSFKQKAMILAPSNILVDQYLGDYPNLPVLHGKVRYFCSTLGINLKDKTARKLKLCSEALNCEGCADYLRDSRRIRVVPYGLANYHVYMAYRLSKSFNTLIVDEAHNLIPIMQELGASKVWYHKLPPDYRYSLGIRTREELRQWISEVPDELIWDEDGKTKRTNLAHFRKAANSEKYIFRVGVEDYDGDEQHCIKLIPIDLLEEPQVFFPPSIKKIVLMSATISPKDVEQMGLYTRRIKYISAHSPIPAEQRPLHLLTNDFSMSYREQDNNLDKLVELIRNLISEYPEDKGLIHAPYSLAQKIQARMSDHPRLLFHTQENKMAKYREFRSLESPAVLVASGLYEGVDLPYEAGRFQLIAKIPFPSLGESAIAYKAEKDPKWYAWETIKLVQQACGRICRGPDDFGRTVVADRGFRRLLDENPEFFPEWFTEAIQEVEITE